MVPLLPDYEYLEIVPGKRGVGPQLGALGSQLTIYWRYSAAGWRPEEIVEELEILIEAIYNALRFASNLGDYSMLLLQRDAHMLIALERCGGLRA